ncbi:MAG: cbb3-type cytochrome oxidase assembly protein CcoS [Waddliaceae bacterium]
MIVFLFSTLLVALAGLLAYLYFLKNGQFEDMEDVKYQVFHEEED